MTDKQLDALEAAAKAATPGPWETDYRQRYVFAENGVNVCEIRGYGELIHMVPECEAVEQMRANANFIAAVSPAVVLDLITELRQARRERDWLASQLEGACYSAEDAEYCSLHDCNDCKYTSAKVWLEAAKEAVK